MIKSKIYRGSNGQRSVLIPAALISLLDMSTDDYCLFEVQKYQPAYQRVCQAAQEKKKPVQILYGDRKSPKKLTGNVADYSQEACTIYNELSGSHSIPYSMIISIDTVK